MKMRGNLQQFQINKDKRPKLWKQVILEEGFNAFQKKIKPKKYFDINAMYFKFL